MASNTPERAPPVTANMSVRRSFTLPPRIQPATRPSPTSTNNADGIETLFICASTKIVSFTASAASRRPSPVRRSNNPDDKPRLIPWKSPTERTLAVGVLRIYRVTASNVSFLNSGNLLHTIFPKSQCWCVDGESTFVLRIRQDSYYRMELPFQTDEDKGTVEQFQAVLGQVLQYERTPCPFKRGFEVELPERPKTPPPRRRPKTQPEKAKKWLFDKTWVPEDGPRPSTPVLEGSDSGTTSSYEEDDRSSINTDRSETVPESPGTVLDITPPRAPPMPSVSERAKLFQKRAVTAPVDLDAVAAKSCAEPEQSKEEERQETSEEKPPTERQVSSDTLSTISTTDSFYSMDTAAQGTPSPPYLDAEDETLNPWAEEHSPQEQEEPRGRGRHRRQISDITVKSPSVGKAEFAPPVTPTITTPTIDVHPSSAPSTPPLLVSDSDDEDSFEPPFMDVPTPPAAIRMRKLTGASQRRAFSPMPHPHNIFFPPRTHQRGPFTAVLIRKTCELVLGPPAHLVSLMLHIAARISNGFGFGTYRVRHTDEKIPCSWESSDDDWAEEDDFGIPLHNLDDSRIRKRDPASVELD